MHEELFNVGDLRKVRNLEKSNKLVPNTLNKKVLYIGGWERCYKVTEVFAGDVSGQSTTFLHTVMKALKAKPMKTVRDFQRRRYGTPPTLLGAHLNRLTGNLDSNNSSIQDIL